ncbi:MAG: hypothetical protein ISS59_09240 [Desulfobacteraceae bacterium]|nr:hypothetical protein [Desulfobacteraceae bacterium]
MKKILIAFSVLAMVGFMAGPALAVLGTNDAVPGTDVLVPFFFVEKASGLENTYIVVTEVGTAAATLNADMYTVASVSHKDWVETLTIRECNPINVKAILDGMGSTPKAAYEITLNSLTYYAGYITLNQGTSVYNDNLIAWAYQIDLANGRASATPIPTLEFANWAPTGPVITNAVLRTATNKEALTPNALAYAMDRMAGNTGTATAGAFRLVTRFYMSETGAKNYLFIYSTTNQTTGASTHVKYWTEAETAYSTTIPLTQELNIIDLSNYLDTAVTAGSIEWRYPQTGYSSNNLSNVAEQVMLGYNYMQVDTTTAGSWNMMVEMHRDASTTSTL